MNFKIFFFRRILKLIVKQRIKERKDKHNQKKYFAKEQLFVTKKLHDDPVNNIKYQDQLGYCNDNCFHEGRGLICSKYSYEAPNTARKAKDGKYNQRGYREN
ncbi:hypothetical protein HC174_02390 [Salinimicrobium sp. CDJ15-81-2]|nr:hypothetical protein [Salinimicrobium nanhaiense]